MASEKDLKSTCFKFGVFDSVFCKSATRNAPYDFWNPGFVVFVLSVEHIQKSIEFAKNHSLCLMVAGTGHDFMNRHSCDQGVFVRTILLKQVSYDLSE